MRFLMKNAILAVSQKTISIPSDDLSLASCKVLSRVFLTKDHIRYNIAANKQKFGVPYDPNKYLPISDEFYNKITPFTSTILKSRDVLDWLYSEILYKPFIGFPFYNENATDPKAAYFSANLVPGNYVLWNDEQQSWFFAENRGPIKLKSTGPRLMLIGKSPGYEENHKLYSFIGDIGVDFLNLIVDALGDDVFSYPIYVTNYCKAHVPYLPIVTQANKLGNDQFNLLWNEILIVRPDILIVVPTGTLRLRLTKLLAIQDSGWGTIPESKFGPAKPVKTCFIPFKFSFDVRQQLRSLRIDLGGKEDYPVQYEIITTADHLEKVLHDCENAKDVAIDCEWEGRHPINSDAFLRTIQFAVSPQQAYIIELHSTDGKTSFDDWTRGAELLKRFLLCSSRNVVGSFVYTDIIWLKHHGIDITEKFKTNPIQIDDVAMMMRAINEEASLDLCNIVMRYKVVQRWDTTLNAYCKEHGLETYGKIPNEVLYPYAAKDVCYILLILDQIRSDLKFDNKGNNCTDAYIMLLKAIAVASEMMDVGVMLDLEKYEELRQKFKKWYDTTLQDLREKIKWPDFDPRKSRHKIEFLFGEQYLPKNKRNRPEKALSLGLNPVISTTNSVTMWKDLEEETKQFSNPSTNKFSCGILAAQHEYARTIYNLQVIDQLLKTIFGKKGLRYYCCADLRIRSFFTPTLKTGRFSSSRPNLQNLSKRRDEIYSLLLNEPIKLRSILRPAPGHAIIMMDIVAAELMALAIMSGDELLFDHCLRSTLPEDHPNHYDIHSNVAVNAFNLRCKPTKAGLDEIGKSHLRVAAKSILYGINYGRTPETIQLEIKAQGVEISIPEIEQIISTIHSQYHKSKELLNRLQEVPVSIGWMRTYFGKYKRFEAHSYHAIINKQQREAMNFLFQATIADIMTLFMYNLWSHPDKDRLGYRILLPIHDEIWVEVQEQYIEETSQLMKNLFSEIKLPRWDIDGSPIDPEKQYTFSAEISIKKAK